MTLNLPTDEVFLTTEEVLEYLQVNLRTVYRLIKAGKIPAVRVGRQWRFRKRDLDAWLDRPFDPVTPHLLRNRTCLAHSYVLVSETGGASSYRNPKFSVRLGRMRKSSWIYAE